MPAPTPSKCEQCRCDFGDPNSTFGGLESLPRNTNRKRLVVLGVGATGLTVFGVVTLAQFLDRIQLPL